MAHDIYLRNKTGDYLGHVRFTMGDYNAMWFYDLFDAQQFNAGVSGSGDIITLSLPQMEKAHNKFKINGKNMCRYNDQDFRSYQQNVISEFIKTGIETARKEESVEMVFC